MYWVEALTKFKLNQYDFSARFYDPVIGRFNVIDPFADFAADFTSYRFAFDNPVSYNDPAREIDKQ